MDETIRSAASAVVGRDCDEGFEVLVLERSDRSRFLPGYVAFPGGAADGLDADLAGRWFDSAEEGARACAVRELVEEVSLALTADGLVHSGTLEAVDEAPPSAEQLPEIAHWIAPPVVPVRFDTRFFALRAAAELEPVADGVETSAAWWDSPRGLLEDWQAGRRLLYWPTFFTMNELARCGSVDELLELRIETREPDDDELERLPRSTFWQD
ncbi:MAG TPA: NUDIX domain-containing protein [Actinomycetota bacterium]|nr:NUDIX domain-containing protein [Actinomycetota bacterium]